MIELRPTSFDKIQNWFVDYQKKSKNYEMPSDTAELLGIFRGEELIGYFIYSLYVLDEKRILEINQGYLCPASRHKNLSKISMQLLENKAKEANISKVILATNRAVGSYIQFMKGMGYEIEKAIFSKTV